MSIVKKIRENSGYTQIELAKKTSLSLRTIQRLESSNTEPKGHSLTMLAFVFDIEPSKLQEEFKNTKQTERSETTSIRLINLSVLAFLGFPFGNIILPFIIWRNKRKSKRVDEAGRKIINLQILWSIILCLSLIVSPFINVAAVSPFPVILIVLLIAIIINIIVVITTARALQNNNLKYLNPPIRFL